MHVDMRFGKHDFVIRKFSNKSVAKAHVKVHGNFVFVYDALFWDGG